MGEIDGQGKLHIIDRKKNLEELYVNGRSVWITPGPIESIMAEVDKVARLPSHNLTREWPGLRSDRVAPLCRCFG